MGSKKIQQMYIRIRINSLVIVALSAEPPGVNELCVCCSMVHTTTQAKVVANGHLSSSKCYLANVENGVVKTAVKMWNRPGIVDVDEMALT